MFAVKGWSVDAASLKPQTEIFRPTKPQDGEPQKSSRKRKRGHRTEAKQDPNIKADDVGRLWEQHVEGKDFSKSQKKREKKKQKLEQMREEKTGPYELPNAMSKPKGQRKIERWEDIVLGTRAEKMGLEKKKGKRKERKVEDEDREVESEDASEGEDGVVGATKGRENDVVPAAPAPSQSTSLTPMQSAMRQKLISARFRHLNQTLYTEPSSKAQELFSQNPEMFEDYHAGFRQQVSIWPENPLDKFIIEIRRRGKIKPHKFFTNRKRKANASARAPPPDPGFALPRTNGTCVIADLGCGDARIAHTLKVSGDTTTLNLKLLSYDLHAPSSLVTKADISALPLADNSMDVAIFCLALMGTNWLSFIEEAHRILHWKGELWIAEIKSRFGRVSKTGRPVDHSVGGKRKVLALKKAQETLQKEQDEVNEDQVLQTEVDGVATQKEETDVSAFVDVLKRRGFILKPPGERSVDLKNKMFVKMEFVKALVPMKGKGVLEDGGKGKGVMQGGKKKFVPDVEEVETEDEMRVLKPSLYKIR